MMMARSDTRVGLTALWIPILAGPVLWSLSEIVLYPVAAQSCYTGFLPAPVPPGAAGARWFGAIWMVASIVLAALVVVLAVRSFRKAHEDDAQIDAVLVRVRFMSYAGLIVSAVFLFATLINGLAIALSGSPCG